MFGKRRYHATSKDCLFSFLLVMRHNQCAYLFILSFTYVLYYFRIQPRMLMFSGGVVWPHPVVPEKKNSSRRILNACMVWDTLRNSSAQWADSQTLRSPSRLSRSCARKHHNPYRCIVPATGRAGRHTRWESPSCCTWGPR